MNIDNIAKIRANVSEHFDINESKLTDEAVLSELGFDELDLQELLLVIEEATDAYIRDESLTKQELRGKISFGRLCQIAGASPPR